MPGPGLTLPYLASFDRVERIIEKDEMDESAWTVEEKSALVEMW